MAAYCVPAYHVELVREPGVKLAERPQATTPAGAAAILREYIGDTDRETFVLAMLTVRGCLIGLHTVSVGCLTSSIAHPREVFKPAILASAASIIVGHNHPSGDPEPSATDIALTRRLHAAGKLLGIDLLDSLILGEARSYVSLKERGIL